MSHEFATMLLNRLRDGANVPRWLVDMALELTGDLAGVRV
jgi:hypothetical protein